MVGEWDVMAIPVQEEALFWSLVVLDGEKSNFKNQHHRQGLERRGLDRSPSTGCQCDERSFIGQGALKPFAVPSGHSGEPRGGLLASTVRGPDGLRWAGTDLCHGVHYLGNSGGRAF